MMEQPAAMPTVSGENVILFVVPYDCPVLCRGDEVAPGEESDLLRK
jgi:hypothetical protein